MEDYSMKLRWRRFFLHLFYIIILSIIIFLLESWQNGEYVPIDFYTTFYFTFFCWFGSLLISLYAVKIFNKIEETLIRIVISVAVILIYILFIVLVSQWTFEEHSEDFWTNYITCTVITLFISSIYLTIDYFKLYKQKVEETEELKRIQIENELKILSNQVNPHFLFNSLNTLMAIIPEDSKKALHFTECFSKVYRYALKNKDNETVTLQEELELISDYCYLLKIRFGDNFNCDINVPDRYRGAIMPPFVVQLLVENATKHNTISQSEPLKLKIYTESEGLVVFNNINEKISESTGTQTGLKNIAKRLNYLTGKNPEIDKNENYFKVTVPLIFTMDYESDHYRG